MTAFQAIYFGTFIITLLSYIDKK
ncbi:putative holin-like toxin [Bacillus changyiensis]